MMYAPSEKDLYTGGSYISFGSKALVRSRILPYDKSEFLVGRFNMNDLKMRKKYKTKKIQVTPI